VRPQFWSMLSDILRFNRESCAWLASHPDKRRSLRDFLDEGRYSRAFSEWYLLPMAAAIWSCPTARMLDTPLATFVRFCQNHGLLQVFDRPLWRTVKGGGRTYVQKIAAQLDDIRLACPVTAVRHGADGLRVHTPAGSERFDQVVMACHADQSLRLLADASPAEQSALGAIRFQDNHTVLHRDPAFMPERRRCWASWIYRTEAGMPADAPVGVTYWMNRLQNIPQDDPLFITLNPHRPIRDDLIFDTVTFRHPIFDAAALAAQRAVDTLQGERQTWFAGAWLRNGFHEDGFASAVRIAQRLTPVMA